MVQCTKFWVRKLSSYRPFSTTMASNIVDVLILFTTSQEPTKSVTTAKEILLVDLLSRPAEESDPRLYCKFNSKSMKAVWNFNTYNTLVVNILVLDHEILTSFVSLFSTNTRYDKDKYYCFYSHTSYTIISKSCSCISFVLVVCIILTPVYNGGAHFLRNRDFVHCSTFLNGSSTRVELFY